MNNFIFQNTTKIYFGNDQMSNLVQEVENYGTKVLLIYGKGSIKKVGLYDEIKERFATGKIQIIEFCGVDPNPLCTAVTDAAKICRENKIEVILAVGGGSVIDCAKAVSVATFYEGDSWELVTKKVEVTNALPVIVIGTVAATGSEMNCSSVISNNITYEKRGFSHNMMQPKVAFLNPKYTYTVNRYQTACGSADILSHILDVSYFTKSNKLQMLDEVRESLMRNIIKYAPIAMDEPENYEARANLMWTATWALNGFIKNEGAYQMPSCHTMEHELSAFYNINHGEGIAILTPRWMTYVLDEDTVDIFATYGKQVWNINSELPAVEIAKMAIKETEKFLFETLQLTSSLSSLGIDDSKFKIMAERACKQGKINGFKELTPDDVEQIYRMCL